MWEDSGISSPIRRMILTAEIKQSKINSISKYVHWNGATHQSLTSLDLEEALLLASKLAFVEGF